MQRERPTLQRPIKHVHVSKPKRIHNFWKALQNVDRSDKNQGSSLRYKYANDGKKYRKFDARAYANEVILQGRSVWVTSFNNP